MLHEGDDFGKLALVNDAPRAATIVTREENCHLLRVDKHDFNRILRVSSISSNSSASFSNVNKVDLLHTIP